ncbi:MAG: hypothetical protein GY778_14460 [bacterium]|nr:hypothetical protein [bacterium]
MKATLRPIPDYPDYFARADGTILRQTVRGLRKRKTRLHEGGVYIRIKIDYRTHEPSVGHLVLTAFVGRCPRGHRAVHLDGNPLNNRLANLAWRHRSETSPYPGRAARKRRRSRRR